MLERTLTVSKEDPRKFMAEYKVFVCCCHSFAVEELYGTRYQSGSFSLITVWSGLHCLRRFSLSFSFLLLSLLIVQRTPDSKCE